MLNADSFNEFRKKRVNLIADRYNVDVIILSLPENINYFSGFFPTGMAMLHSVETYLVYNVSDGQMVLITAASDLPTVLESGYNGEIYPLGDFKFYIPNKDKFSDEVRKGLSARYGDIAEAIYTATMKICPGIKTLFVDEARMPVSTWNSIRGKLSHVHFFTDKNIIEEIRKVKHFSEIELLRKSANIAENALMIAISKITIGMSEYEIEMNYKQEVLKQGAEPYFCVATIDERAAFSDTINQKNNKVERGSMIRFDFGCIYNGYRSDLARTVIVSGNKKAERYYDAILEGEEKAIESIAPGITAEEIFNIAVETTRRAGIEHYSRHHVGHGIGVATYDLPSIKPNDKTVLEENMVLCIETPYYEIGWGGIQVEDTIVVTSTGAEYLSKSPRTLINIEL